MTEHGTISTAGTGRQKRQTEDNIEACVNRYNTMTAQSFSCYGHRRCEQSSFCPVARGQEPKVVV